MQFALCGLQSAWSKGYWLQLSKVVARLLLSVMSRIHVFVAVAIAPTAAAAAAATATDKGGGIKA